MTKPDLYGMPETNASKLQGDNEVLRAENERLRAEVELWKGRWEAERADHETTMKQTDEMLGRPDCY